MRLKCRKFLELLSVSLFHPVRDLDICLDGIGRSGYENRSTFFTFPWTLILKPTFSSNPPDDILRLPRHPGRRCL